MKKIVLIIPAVLFLYACGEEGPETENQELAAKYTLVAGEVFNDSINYFEFEPYISVKGRRNGVDTNYTYHDSVWIDLQDDGSDDLYFEYYRYHFQPSCDCEGIDCCMPIDELYIKFKIGSNIEIASREFYGPRPERFSSGDSIDSRCDWQKYSRKTDLFLIGEEEDVWWIDNFNSFLGVRILSSTDTCYAWLRINPRGSGPIEIYDYAVEK